MRPASWYRRRQESIGAVLLIGGGMVAAVMGVSAGIPTVVLFAVMLAGLLLLANS